MKEQVKGRAHVYGDNVDTDRIIPGKYTKTLDTQSLAAHVLEDLDPNFRARMQPGDVLVAGDNFGCGSSREQAPVAIKVAGISAVVARYFARIFFRNAINIGLPVLEAPDHRIQSGDVVTIDFERGLITNHTKQETYAATQLPPVMLDILREGGLAPYLHKHGQYLGI